MAKILARSLRYQDILDAAGCKTRSLLTAPSSGSTRRMLHDVARWLRFNYSPYRRPESLSTVKRCLPYLIPSRVPQVRYCSYDSNDVDLEMSFEDWKRQEAADVHDGFTEEEREHVYNREYAELNPHDFYASLAPDESDPQHIKIRTQIDLILSEYESTKYATMRVPLTISVRNMEGLLRVLTEEGMGALNSYFNYLYRKELDKYFQKKSQERKKLMNWERIYEKRLWIIDNADWSVFDKEGKPIYTLWKNTMFMRFHKHPLTIKGAISRLRRAALFGTPLIFDFSWHKEMNKRECKDMAMQVQYAHSTNRASKDPFDLWFVNLSKDSHMYEALTRELPVLARKDHMIRISDKNYTDLFDKRRLVYLTPYGKNEMQQFDESLIYIIACYKDKKEGPNTYCRARQEGLGHVSLPLNKYLEWGTASKALCLNHYIEIFDRLKMGDSWKEALSHGVPIRKLKTADEVARLNQRRIKMIKKAAHRIETRSLLVDDEEPVKRTLRNVKALADVNERIEAKTRLLANKDEEAY